MPQPFTAPAVMPWARLAARNDFDLAVVDHMMPGMTGVDLVRGLRAAGSTLRVLMLTARSQERDLENGFTAGWTTT